MLFNNNNNNNNMTGVAKVNGLDVKFRSADSCDTCSGSLMNLAIRSPICNACINRKVFRKCWSPACNAVFCAATLDTISADGWACCQEHAPPASGTVPVSISFYRHNANAPEVTSVLAEVPIWTLFPETVVKSFLSQQLLGDYLQLGSLLGAWKFSFSESVYGLSHYESGVEAGWTVRGFLEFLLAKEFYRPTTMMGTLTKTTGFPFAELTLGALLDPTSTLSSVYNADLLRLEATVPRNTATAPHIMLDGLLMNTCLPPNYGGFSVETGAFSFNMIHYSEMEERKDRRDQQKAAFAFAPAPAPAPAGKRSKSVAVKARKSSANLSDDEEETKAQKVRKGKGTKGKRKAEDVEQEEEEASAYEDVEGDEDEDGTDGKKRIVRVNRTTANTVRVPSGNDAAINAWFARFGGKKPAPGAKHPVDARNEDHPHRVIFQVPGADKFYWRLNKDFEAFCSPRRKNGGHHQFYMVIDFADDESMINAVGMMHQINYHYSNHLRSTVVMELISAILHETEFDHTEHDNLLSTNQYMARDKLVVNSLFVADRRPKNKKRGLQGKDTSKHGLVSGPLNAPSAPKKYKTFEEELQEEEDASSSSSSSSSVPQPPALPTPDFSAAIHHRHNTQDYIPASPSQFMVAEVDFDDEELL